MQTRLKITFDLEVITEDLSKKEVSEIVLKKLDFSEYMFQENLHGKEAKILIISKKGEVKIA